jgi:hypothetical protein
MMHSITKGETMKNLIILTACLIGLGMMQSCGKRDVLTSFGNLGSDAVYRVGKGIEHLGQQPKNIFREVLDINRDREESKKADKHLSEEDKRLQKQIDELLLSLTALYSSVGDVQVDQDSLSQDVALNTLRLAELESQESIVEFIDPCGDYPGRFDEVLMVTSSGSYVAYFQSGGRRFLTVLPDGNYRTTDFQRCRFTISNGIYSE